MIPKAFAQNCLTKRLTEVSGYRCLGCTRIADGKVVIEARIAIFGQQCFCFCAHAFLWQGELFVKLCCFKKFSHCPFS